MAHRIMGDRFISRVQPAWHNIAREIFPADSKISAREAMAKVAGDIEFLREPLFYEVNGARMATDKIAVVRKPTPDAPSYEMLGIATGSWQSPSYTDLASKLDELAKTYPVETAGLLNDGGLAFLCFKGEDWAVRGDAMRSYFAANFSMTPGQGHSVFHSPTRIVCWNTNQMALGQATINLSIPHSADAMMRVELASKLVVRFHEMKDKAKAIFESFADKQITQKDVDTIIYAAFQMPALPSKLKLIKTQLSDIEAQAFKSALSPTMVMDLVKEQERYDRQVENTVLLREAAQESFEKFNPNNLRGTVWAAYNAVTEVSDWREGRNADQSALFGSRAKEKGRAYEAAFALIS